MSTTELPPDTASVTALAEPHHDGSELYVERLGESAIVRMRALRVPGRRPELVSGR